MVRYAVQGSTATFCHGSQLDLSYRNSDDPAVGRVSCQPGDDLEAPDLLDDKVPAASQVRDHIQGSSSSGRKHDPDDHLSLTTPTVSLAPALISVLTHVAMYLALLQSWDSTRRLSHDCWMLWTCLLACSLTVTSSTSWL